MLGCIGGGHDSPPSNKPGPANSPPASALISVLTYHNDGQRTGLNPNETTLNPTNVNAKSFGRLFSLSVDGQLYTQPLYVFALDIAGGTHNVVFVATEHNTVYAFDADGLTSAPLWKRNLGASVPAQSTAGISPEIGITGTPVIDGNTNTLYVVAQKTSGFWLHAPSLGDGSEKFGGPVKVTATVAGTGVDSVNGGITLEASCLQRAGLALVDGMVFIGFGSCPHGWLLGYDAQSLRQLGVFNGTPNGSGGTVWMSGGAPATDGQGNLYIMTGVNFDSVDPGYNDSFVKLRAVDLYVIDFFTPSNESILRTNDADLGSGAPMVLPDNSSAHAHEVVGAGKDGRVFLLDRGKMGGFSPPVNPACATSLAPQDCDQTVQTLPNIGNSQFNNVYGMGAYWNGFLYFHPHSSTLKAFQYNNGMLSGAVAAGSTTFGAHGATPSVSSNGTSAGIVWELQVDGWKTGAPAILHAHDASNVAHELYNSSQAPNNRDAAGPAVKFTTPTIANGRVYVGTANQLDVYGLLQH
jgi:hypothetical protein